MKPDVFMTMKKTTTKPVIETLSGKIATMTVTKTEKSGFMTMKPKPKNTSISYIMLLATKVSTNLFLTHQVMASQSNLLTMIL